MRSVVTPRLAMLAFAHFTIDAYSSFFSPLLPLLVTKLDLSLTLVGTLVALASISSSFSQPVFGLLADRIHRPWFIAFGPLVAALFLSGIGVAPTFSALLALLEMARRSELSLTQPKPFADVEIRRELAGETA